MISALVLAFLILIPLIIKWELDKKFSISMIGLIGILSGLIANRIKILWNLETYQILSLDFFLIITTFSLLLLWRFYRDPERISPEDESAILSPADGKIIYIKKIEKGKIPFSEKKGKTFSLNDFIQADVLPHEGYLIGIAMTYLDVHVNRAPISGRINLIKHIKGIFISLKRKEAVIQNERALIIVDGKHFKLGIVQIASRLVRKIVPYIKEGQEVDKGDRIGMIKLGSQVDLILPKISSLEIKVHPGDKVKAGSSIIAQC